MELLLNSQEERCRILVYNEYLKKIPQLLQQLEVVEEMYEKALLEEAMLPQCGPEDASSRMYAERLLRTKEQCLRRSEDIRQQLRLILALKRKIETESSALQNLMK